MEKNGRNENIETDLWGVTNLDRMRNERIRGMKKAEGKEINAVWTCNRREDECVGKRLRMGEGKDLRGRKG